MNWSLVAEKICEHGELEMVMRRRIQQNVTYLFWYSSIRCVGWEGIFICFAGWIFMYHETGIAIGAKILADDKKGGADKREAKIDKQNKSRSFCHLKKN